MVRHVAVLGLLAACSRTTPLASGTLEGGSVELTFVAAAPVRARLVVDAQSSSEVPRQAFAAAVAKSEVQVTLVEGGPGRTITCAATNGVSRNTKDDDMKRRPLLREAANDCDLGPLEGAVRMKVALVWRGEGTPPRVTAHVVSP